MTIKEAAAGADASAAEPTEFDKLLAEVDVLSKAMGPGGKTVATAQAASEEAAGKDENDADDQADNVDGKNATNPAKGKKKGAALAKSFTIKLEDGTEVEAEDGTELVKSLTLQLAAQDANLTKGLTALVNLFKPQQDLIKSLTEEVSALKTQVASLGSEGRGRKAIVSVVDTASKTQADLAKGGDKGGIDINTFMAKASTAFHGGKITGGDLALAEACANRGGVGMPERIVSVVMAQ